MKIIIVFLFIIWLTSSMVIWDFSMNDDFRISQKFCEKNGYDGVEFLGGGVYSQYYGKVKCYANFDEDFIIKIFNVTVERNPFRSLEEVKE